MHADNSKRPRFVTAEEVAHVLDAHLEDFVTCVKDTFIEYSSGLADNPLRSWIPTSSSSGLICMPGHVRSQQALAVKLLMYGPGRYGGTVALFDPTHASLLALMDTATITEYRTAAMSIVATRLLAARAPRRLGVYGAGLQARVHTRLMAKLFALEEVTVWNHREESGKRFVNELTASGVRARWCSDPSDAAQELIVTATRSTVPVLKRKWLPAQCHVNAVGAPQKDAQELEVDVLKDARIVAVDSKESAFAESGDIIKSGLVDIVEIGALLKNATDATSSAAYEEASGDTRTNLTVFKSLGIAVQDAATAKFIWDRLGS